MLINLCGISVMGAADGLLTPGGGRTILVASGPPVSPPGRGRCHIEI